jgi:hypothetical protein
MPFEALADEFIDMLTSDLSLVWYLYTGSRVIPAILGHGRLQCNQATNAGSCTTPRTINLH